MTWLSLFKSLGFPGGSAGKESTHNVGDLGSILGLGRSPGEGKGYPLQYSGVGNSMNCIVQGVAKSQIQLSDCHTFKSLNKSSFIFPSITDKELFSLHCVGQNVSLGFPQRDLYSMFFNDYMGKESKKEWIYVYVLLIHFAVAQKLSQHCESTILQQKINLKKHGLVLFRVPEDVSLLGHREISQEFWNFSNL